MKPAAYADTGNVDACSYEIEFQFPAYSTKFYTDMSALYSEAQVLALLEPLLKDAERFRWAISNTQTHSNALIDAGIRRINGDNPTVDEWRDAYDAAIEAEKQNA